MALTMTQAGAQTRWEMPTPYPAGLFQTRNAAQFAAEIEAATNGSLKITTHPAGAMFKHPQIKGAVAKGDAQIGEVLISIHGDENPIYAADTIPFLVSGYAQARSFYAAQKPFLEKALAAEGLVLLYSVPWPPQGLYAKREIRTVEDLEGLKFRTYNATTERIAVLAKALPVRIEVPDLPAAFLSGRVDVMITSASSGVETKAETYLSHYHDAQAWIPRNVVFANKAAFDALPPRERDAVLAAASVAEARGWKLGEEEGEVRTNMLKAAGIVVTPPSAALASGLARIGSQIAQEWAKSAGEDGRAIIDAFRK